MQYLRGQFTRDEIKKRYLPLMAILAFGFLLLSWWLYPPQLHYSIFTHTISYLGDWSKTPGWWAWSIAMCVLAISFFPLILYIHRRLNQICLKTARVGSFFGVVACACIFILGFVSDVSQPLVGPLTWDNVHMFFTYGGFGGMGISVIFYSIVFTKDHVPRFGGKQVVGPKRSLPPHLLIFGVAIATGVSQAIKEVLYPNAGWNGPGLTSISFWEWMLMFSIFIYVFWVALILPEKFPTQ
ncbi:MAG TPA: hypothetical protein VKK79_16870 [Candidatus Lokiarchaeia archaeon]|nr:hypothetical protein [Candidatus Lokiarchaeia archaeon]